MPKRQVASVGSSFAETNGNAEMQGMRLGNLQGQFTTRAHLKIKMVERTVGKNEKVDSGL